MKGLLILYFVRFCFGFLPILILSKGFAIEEIPDFERASFYHEGMVREYYYWTPNPDEGRPALLILHDEGQSHSEVFGKNAGGMNDWLEIARREGWWLFCPMELNPVPEVVGGQGSIGMIADPIIGSFTNARQSMMWDLSARF
jgi:hypothetical protein